MRIFVLGVVLLLSTCSSLPSDSGPSPQSTTGPVPTVPDDTLSVAEADAVYPYFKIELVDLSTFSQEEKKFILDTLDFAMLMVNTEEFAEKIKNHSLRWLNFYDFTSELDPSKSLIYGDVIDKNRILAMIQRASQKLVIKKAVVAPHYGLANAYLKGEFGQGKEITLYPYFDDLALMSQGTGTMQLSSDYNWSETESNSIVDQIGQDGTFKVILKNVLHTIGVLGSDYPISSSSVTSSADAVSEVVLELWHSDAFKQKYADDFKKLKGYHQKKFLHLL